MIELRGIEKKFTCGGESFCAIKDITLSLPEKGLYFIVGKSGSGKSTLLGILGGLLSPSKGTYLFEGEDVTTLNLTQRQRFLSSKISFVFQESNLIRDFSVEENIAIAGLTEHQLNDIIVAVGLPKKAKERSGNLSGGEAQRVAIARAMTKQTKVLLMDEPTGNLDVKNSKKIFELAHDLSHDILVVIVTHDIGSAYSYGDEIITLSDGKIIRQEKNEKTLRMDLKKPLDDCQIDSFLCASVDTESVKLITEDGNEKEMLLPSSNKKGAILRTLIQNLGKAEAIELEKRTPASVGFKIQHNGKPNFGLKERFRYASALTRKKLGKGMATALILALGLGLILFQSSVSHFDETAAMQDAFTSERMTLSPLMKKQENENLKEIGEYRTGEDFYAEIQNKFGAAYPIITGLLPEAISPTVCYVIPTDQPLTLFDEKTYSPSANGIFISPFLRDIAAKNDQLKINFRESAWSADYTFDIQGTYDCDYVPLDMVRHQADPSFQYRQRDLFRGKYAFVLASSTTCLEILQNCNRITLMGGNPSLYDIPSTKNYFDAALDYSCYKSEALVCGTMPSKAGESVISSSFARLCFPTEMTQNPAGIIGQRLKYKDLRKSPNWVSYQNHVNVFDVAPELLVTGITEDSKSSIYLSNSDWLELCRRELRCSTAIAAYNQNPGDLGKNICASGFYCEYSFASPIYQLANLSHSALSYVAMGIGVALTIICTAFLSLQCVSEIKERAKEIAILKSLGIKEGSILSSFIIQTGYCVLPAFLASVGLGMSAICGLNSAVQSPEVYGISYHLFSFEPSSIAVCFLICVTSIALSLLIPIRKLRRTDIYDTLKS